MARLLLRDLTPGTSYKVQLRAVGNDSVSQWSRRFNLSATTDSTAPDVPAWAVSGDFVVNGDTFVATWQALNFALDQNKDFDHYEVEFSDGTTAVVVRTTNTSHTLTFDQNRIYFSTPKASVYARVRAVDAVGNPSAWTSQKNAVNAAPNAPASISTTALVESISVAWTPAASPDLDLVGYKLQVSTTSNTTGFSDIYTGPDLSYVHNTIMFTTNHWFRVYAVDKFGSLSSATTSGAIKPKSTFIIDTTPPAAPTTVTPTASYNTSTAESYIDLSWTAVTDSDLQDYIIQYGQVSGSVETVVIDKSVTTARLVVVPGQSYYISVAARDYSGNVSSSTAATGNPITAAKASAPSTPSAPTNATNTLQIQVSHAGTKAAGGTLEKWVAYYEVYAGTAANPTTLIGTIPASTLDRSGSEVFDIPASAGTGTSQNWITRVKAVDIWGQKSGYSADSSAASVPLISTTNIGDAQITNAKINDLAVNKLTAGSGFVNDLIVKSKFTLGDASTVGYIESYDYTSSSGTTGFQFSKNGLIIKTGTIEAVALNIQAGQNIVPARQASFEGISSSYALGNGWYAVNGSFLGAINTTGGKFGPQKFGAIWGSQAANVSIGFANSSTDYNIPTEAGKTYIFSLYAYGPNTINSTLKIKWSNGTVTTLDSKTLTGTNTATDTTRNYGTATAPTGTTGCQVIWETTTQSLASGVSIDGIQVEEKFGGSNLPSSWTPPGATTIDGGLIRTGSVVSSTLAKDVNGNDITGVPAWSINTAGNAIFGDALIRGKLVMGITGDYTNSISTDANGNVYEDTSKLAGIGSIQSYNYVPGTSGWAVRSNGYAEFLQLKADSISSASISALSADKLTPGTVIADLIVGTSLKSVDSDRLFPTFISQTGTTVTLTLSDTHTRIVGDQISVHLDPADATADSPGNTLYSIIAVTSSTISYTVPTSRTLGSTATAGYVDVYGRSVIMSPSGVTLYTNDGVTAVVDLPTNPAKAARFSGDVIANNLTVVNNFLLQGQNNSVSAGSTLTLSAGIGAPSSSPSVDYSWDNVQTWMTNDLTAWKSGLWYDSGRYITTNAFFGASVLGINADGSANFNYTAADDAGGEGHVPYGVVKISGKFYVLVNDAGDGLWKVRRYATSGTGFSTLEATWTYDEHTYFGVTSTEWKIDGWNPSALKDPVIGYGTPDGTNFYIYIARCNKAGKIIVSRYNTDGTGGVNTTTNITDNQNLRSINIGQFDYSGYRWVITTEGTTSRSATNYVTNTSGTHQTTETWESPNGNKMWGLCWNGSQFVALASNNRLYWHTGVASTGTNAWYAKAAWYNGVNSGSKNVSAITGTGTTATITTSAAHGYTTGATVYFASTLATALNGQYFTATVTSSTQFTVSSSYVGTVGSGGTVTNEWESPLSPYIAFTATRRANMTLSVGSIPPGGGTELPDRARFYISNTAGGAGNYYRQTNSVASNSQKFTVTPTFSGSTTTLTAFPQSNAASMKSSNGLMEINAGGYALFGSTTDVNGNAGNTPPLRLGNVNGTHMRLDGNEIQVMNSNTTNDFATLILQQSGGNITMSPNGQTTLAGTTQFGTGGHTISKIRRNSTSVTAAGGTGSNTVSHGGGTAPDMVVATPRQAGTNVAIQVGNVGASTFEVFMYVISTGAALANGNSKTIDWVAIWF